MAVADAAAQPGKYRVLGAWIDRAEQGPGVGAAVRREQTLAPCDGPAIPVGSERREAGQRVVERAPFVVAEHQVGAPGLDPG